MKVGFIGLGNMGLPMAKNLIKAGFEVYGVNRSQAAEEKLEEAGGRRGPAIAELAAKMDIILTCLPMPADVEKVYLGEEGLIENGRSGLVLVDCSTVNPELNRKLYEAAAKRGLAFLDAPVSGGTTGAAAGTLSIMVGGKSETFKQALPVFEALGKQIDHVGGSGSGSVVKLINQLMVGIHTQAVSEGLALGRKSDVDEEQLVRILTSSFAGSRMLERHYGNHIVKNDYKPGFAIKLLGKDLDLAVEMAEQSGVGLAVGTRVRSLLRSAIRNGFAGQDMSGMLEYQLQRDEQKFAEPEPIKHFAVFLPMKDADKSVTFREQHLQFLASRREEGKLLANGRFTDGAGGLVIYKGQSLEEVEGWVKEDPYIIEGARHYEIHEWDIVLAE
ncbi:3-hydroxyisobutyrate dehydrogenase [Paenibacillus sp. FSL H8-0548]|uniref:NAD(P)-binding domain-containing protein n=1 Tax=Paenibacillus sp. FSL H8-0548 TaxID=1920422 RepID=UPI00096F1141|nr:NAD(P)-binding domain-containing protein [Paenibacillus sp. FSL H8-0548]OMF23228.1 3-hydroxyisobutyrate dehydrogenase [Paenibacillus sp. FSL H8-0548]